MKQKLNIFIAAVLIIISTFGNVKAATQQGSYFTYQGELMANSVAANGAYDITVELYDAMTGGLMVSSQALTSVAVVDGIFSIQVDVGDVPFMGNENWIELKVRPASTGTFTTLTPRQLITNSPYAIQSQFVGEDGVDAASIKDNSILNSHLSNGIVDTAELIDLAVTNAKIASGAITTGKIALGAVRTDEILNGTIVAADVDSNSIQQRVSAACNAGSSIRQINSDGSVACETDDTGGSSGWGLSGNAGTNPATQFLGTSDDADFVMKVDGSQVAFFDASSRNIIFGTDTNTIGFEGKDSSIAGGSGNTINVNSLSSHMTIGGGSDNAITTAAAGGNSSNVTIAGGRDNVAAREAATIGGGKRNQAIQLFSTVSGGLSNKATAEASTVPGGESNTAGGKHSFAAGRTAVVRDAAAVGGGDTDGDEGTFIWSSRDSYFTSTGPEQFLIQADGGVGIGTNEPKSPIHLVGSGTSNSSIPGSDEVMLLLESNSANGDVALVLDKNSENSHASLVFSENGQIAYDMRETAASGIEFNSYDSSSIATLIMRLIATTGVPNRVDINGNLEPQSGNTFNFGSALFRWKNIYTVNPVDVSSDKRLKSQIENLDYGLAEVLAMRPVSYYWKNGDTEQLHLGLIAQEVENIVPEIVSKTADQAAMRSMRYTELVPVLIKATQEQQIIIDQQNHKIEKLQALVEGLISVQNQK
ncbi:tail fiber domain-containing protein [Marinicella litoralis]|uniref:Endosialidase-like protein n=1 Tax=Marinicella litoralis TaxID=644220 RepID=A0A4R6XQL4_9GAMM|nr:tail fiber domain-containing protein [Marinicella litoralis]TDR20510.1 endosialidase-like protein [Marinicella litoralis]